MNADTSDYVGPTIPCSCGCMAHYAGRRPKAFTTVLGDLTLYRAYYHCENCEHGFCPRDKIFGLEHTSLSPGVTRMVGFTSSLVSFGETDQIIQKLAGISVGIKHVERAAKALGEEISVYERENVEPAPPCAKTMYLGMDGTGIPMRKSELEGRPGKQTDGSSKTREVKLVTVWSAEGRDKEGVPQRDKGSVSYSAAIESAACRDTDASPSQFGQRAAREARRRGFDEAERQVILGDGAKWIWNLADEHFPGALQIVDLFHAKENLSTVSKSIFGPTSEEAAAWAKTRHEELDKGELDKILAALNDNIGNDLARNCRDYIIRNRERMNYPLFRSQGICTSTGVVEAGCKVTIGTRLKRAGMHWSVTGADAIIALRCCTLSGRYEDFWEYRALTNASRICAKLTPLAA